MAKELFEIANFSERIFNNRVITHYSSFSDFIDYDDTQMKGSNSIYSYRNITVSSLL